MSKVTIVDVAKAANVSISSVSRYMSDPKAINQISAVKIAKAIDDLHYIPNSFARNLKRGTANIIGFVQPDITQKMFHHAMKAMNEIFFQNDYLLITCDTDNNPEKELRHVSSLIEQNVAGIIISPCSFRSEATARALVRSNSFVCMDRLIESDTPFSSVIEDNYEKCCLLANEIIKKPGNRYLLLAGIEHSYVTKERTAGIFDTFKAHDILLSPDDIIYNLDDSNRSVQIIMELLKRGYDKVVFTNPKILKSVHSACRESKYEINKHIYVAGYSYEDDYKQLNLSFPCVIQRPYDLGLAAGDLILKNIKKPSNAPKQIKIDAHFYL